MKRSVNLVDFIKRSLTDNFLLYPMYERPFFDLKWKKLNPIQDGLFRGCSLIKGGTFWPPLPKISHTYPTIMKLGTVIPYLKKTQKIYKSRDTPHEFCWHQHFFTRNQPILLHQEIQLYIGFWCIIYNSFNFYWVLNKFFDNHGYNFDDVSKIGYSRPS